MSVLLSGDFHDNARGEMGYLTKSYLIKKFKRNLYKKINYHIILGDGGFLWPGQQVREVAIFETLSERPFPILCVLGNHEPVLGRTDLPVVDIGIGEKVTVVNEKNPFLAYLQRGKVYNIDNRKFLVLGGALSIDKAYRRPNISWWENEYWSKEEEDGLFALLEKENSFDYVLSHTGPQRINAKLFAQFGGTYPLKFHDKVAELNERIDKKINCKQWFCGHWHQVYYYYDEETQRGYQYLYEPPALMTDTEIIAPHNTMLA
jgi:hypothetical protein